MNRGLMAGLDPLLAPALQMAGRPVLPGRERAEGAAVDLTALAERIGLMAQRETDERSAAQLTHIAESMGVAVIALCMYARGVVPRLRENKPDIIVKS